MGDEEDRDTIVAFVPNTTILSVGKAGTGASAEAVPQDHQRYVYFAKMWAPGAATIVSVYESVAGVLALKDQQLLTQNQTLQIPQAGPTGKPIYRFRASGFVRVQLSGAGGATTSGVGLTMLYLDKPGGAVQ